MRMRQGLKPLAESLNPFGIVVSALRFKSLLRRFVVSPYQIGRPVAPYLLFAICYLLFLIRYSLIP